jgi:hypothetical protein
LPQSRSYEEHPSFGRDPEWGITPLPRAHKPLRRKLLTLIALLILSALTGYMTRTTPDGVWADRWTGLFALSMIAAAYYGLLMIPKINKASARVSRHR